MAYSPTDPHHPINHAPKGDAIAQGEKERNFGNGYQEPWLSGHGESWDDYQRRITGKS